jgi:hypothetical protein
MPPRAPTAEDIADWLRPQEALTILDAAFVGKTDTSKHLLIERLKSGVIQGAAESSTWTGAKIEATTAFYIPYDHWRYYKPALGFWDSGDIQFHLGHYKGSIYDISVWYHAVKFHPEAIDALAAIGRNRAKGASSPTSENETEPEQKGPPVSEEDLKQWYAVYRRTYQGADDTMANALKSARGMFPGKFVSRERVRVLAGGRRPGRKSGETS